jgi:hypothetical protein
VVVVVVVIGADVDTGTDTGAVAHVLICGGHCDPVAVANPVCNCNLESKKLSALTTHWYLVASKHARPVVLLRWEHRCTDT